MCQGKILCFTPCTNMATAIGVVTSRSNSVTTEGSSFFGSNLLGEGVELLTTFKQNVAVNAGFCCAIHYLLKLIDGIYAIIPLRPGNRSGHASKPSRTRFCLFTIYIAQETVEKGHQNADAKWTMGSGDVR